MACERCRGRFDKLRLSLRQRERDIREEVTCHLHLRQAAQREEGAPPDPRDAVALGDLAAAQRHRPQSSAGRLITLKGTLHIEVADMALLFFFF